ncbi:MAG: SBBP repeat-containing protein [Crocinitomicaceae bacterium]
MKLTIFLQTLLFLFTLIISSSSNAQNHTYEWSKRIGGTSQDVGRAVHIDDLGNIYTAGTFENIVDFDPGNGVSLLSATGFSDDIFIQKLDVNGNFLWARKIGGTSPDFGYSIAVDGMGNVYTTGMFTGTADFDPGPATLNLTSMGSLDVFVHKMDQNGNLIWVRQMGGTSSEYAHSIALDNSGNPYITGHFEGTADFDPGVGNTNFTSAGAEDIFVQKMDSNGTFLWAKQFEGNSFDRGFSLVLDDIGNVYTTGYFRDSIDFDPGPGSDIFVSTGLTNDIFLQKMDMNGNYLWTKQMSGFFNNISFDVAIDLSGNLYLTGNFGSTTDFDPGAGVANLSSTGSRDAFVQKLNSSGDLIWARKMGGSGYDQGISIIVDSIGNVYTTGSFEGSSDFDPGVNSYIQNSVGNTDIFIQKMDTNGNFLWAKQLEGNSFDFPEEISLDIWGNLFLTGSFEGTVDFDPGTGISNHVSAGQEDAFILKLAPCSNSLGTDVITACSSYSWIDGNTYFSNNTAATHTIIGGASNGCDSIITLNLTILSPSTGTDVRTECSPYLWIDGNTYTANNNSATFTFNNASANGCDSIVTLDLTINNPTGIDTHTSCGPYQWIDGNTYDFSNNTATYTISGGAVNGCDSVVVLDLTVIYPAFSNGTDIRTECSPYTWIDGNAYTSNNNTATYTFVGGAANGCDSIVTLDLTITPVDTSTSINGVTISSNSSGAVYQWLDCNNVMSPISGETSQSYTPISNGNYAVKVTENDCTDTSSCVTVATIGIMENTFDDHFSISPNPTKGELLIQFDKTQQHILIRLYSITGQLIKCFDLNHSQVVELELDQLSGVYLLEIQTSFGDKAIVRVVKE